MKPKASPCDSHQRNLIYDSLFRMLKPGHSLMELADSIDWTAFDEVFGPLYSAYDDAPGKPIRLMVGLTTTSTSTTIPISGAPTNFMMTGRSVNSPPLSVGTLIYLDFTGAGY
jgi:hypothetical protein